MTTPLDVILKRFDALDEVRVGDELYVSLHFLGAQNYARK